MNNKKTIFISYGRDKENPEDVELVIKIKNDLSKEFNVLMDIDRLKEGDDWEIKLETDIESSDWILFFITPYSARRPDGYCLNELTYALYKNKYIAPVMLEHEDPPLSICRIQYLDLQNLKEDQKSYDLKLQELISVLNKEKELGFEGGHAVLLEALHPLKSKTIIAKHSYGFVGRKWIKDKVDHWLKEELDSRVLWITAEAGYGKTALSVYLSESHPSVISIHFCQHDYRESRDPMQMLKVLIYELTTQIEEYNKKLLGLNIKDILSRTAEHIFMELLQEPLAGISPPNKEVVFIIDALDEAKDEDGKNPIVELISTRFKDLPSWLNIIITSRHEPELIRKLKKFNPIDLKANVEKNFLDLKFFIQKQFKDIDGLIVDSLIEISEGNMLYLKSVLELDIIKEGSFTLENIKNLPQGMENFYQQYFERKFEDIDNYKKDFRPFISIMIATKEGMPSNLVAYILNMDLFDFDDLIREAFGSLLEENNNVLTFYHKSIFDWLSCRDKTNYAANIKQGRQLIADKLWEVYIADDENGYTGSYESYLLYALYALKSYKKLNVILQDILFIGQMYNAGKHSTYRQILLKTISDKSPICNNDKLEIYESFFTKNEHLIVQINHEFWHASQTLFQLAYEDGDDSPLSIFIDTFLVNSQIDFSWLRSHKRESEFSRSSLIRVYSPNRKVLDMKEFDDHVILFYENASAEILDLETGQLNSTTLHVIDGVSSHLKTCYSDNIKIVLKNDIFEVEQKNKNISYHLKEITHSSLPFATPYLLSNLKIIYYAYYSDSLGLGAPGIFFHISQDGEVINSFHGHNRNINGVVELKNNRLLSYSDDTNLIVWDLLKGGHELTLIGHTGKVQKAIEIGDSKILSYADDHTLRLWRSDVKNDESHLPSEVLAIFKNGHYISKDINELRVFDKTGAQIVKHEHEFGYISVFELSNNRILSEEEYGSEIKIHIWSIDNEEVSVYDFQRDETINFIRELENGNFVIKANNPIIDQESEDFKLISEHKVYLYENKNKNLFEDSTILLEKICVDHVSVTQTLFSFIAEDQTLYIYSQEGICIYTVLLEDEKKFKFIYEFDNKMFVLGTDKSKVLLFDENANVVKEIAQLNVDINGCIELYNDKFILYEKSEVFILNMNGELLSSFKSPFEVVKVELFNNTMFVIFAINNEILFYDYNGRYIKTFYLSVESEIINCKIIQEELYVNIGSNVLVYTFENLDN